MGEASCVLGWDDQKKMFDFLDDRHGEGTPHNIMSFLRDEKDPLKF